MQSSIIEIIYKNNKPFNIKFNGRLLHSNYDPYNEAKRKWSQRKTESKVFLLIKVGMGYIADFIFKENFHKIYWYEPYYEIRTSIIKRIQLNYPQLINEIGKRLLFLENFNLDFVKGIDKELSDIEIFYLSVPEYLNKDDIIIIDFIFRKKKYIQINRSTFYKFESIWISNLYRNFIKSPHFLPIDVLKGQYINFPCLVVAGGPSLDLWINQIYEIQNSIILIAVDTSLSGLIQNHIYPDFVITVDAQIINYLHLQKYIKNYNFKLVCDPLTYFLTSYNFLKFHNEIYIFNNSFPATGILYGKIFEEFSYLKSGGSVTTTALDFASYLGCNPIYIAGLDLSYPDLKIHSQFSILENYMYLKENRINSRELMNYKQITALPRRYIKNLINQIVLTNDKLLVFKEWFEKNYHQYKEKEIYILYGNGIVLKNYKIIDKCNLYNLINIFYKKNNVNISLKRIFSPNQILHKLYTNFISIKNILVEILELIDSILLENQYEKIYKIISLEGDLYKFEELKILYLIDFEKINLTEYNIDIKENLIITRNTYEELIKKINYHLYSLAKSIGISQN